MKKLFKYVVLFAAAAITLTSCSKDEALKKNSENKLVTVTLIAGNPQVNATTRTEIEGTTPYWSVGDAIGVSDGSSTKNYKFATTIEEKAQTASFTGTTEVSDGLYAYYPYTGNGVHATNGAKVDIPATQKPTVSSFDGAADLLVSKKFTVDEASTTVSNLEFTRLGAIVKVVLKDEETLLSGQHPSEVSLTSSAVNLTGRVYVNFVNQALGELYYNQSKSVKDEYTSSTQFEIDGTNAAYFIVYPQTLASGTTLTVSAATEEYNINKEIELTSDIALTAGKVTTLNISLTSDNITASSTGLSLPFEDDMSWADNGNSDGTSSISNDVIAQTNSNGDKMYSGASSTLYKGIGGMKFGSSSVNGYVTTSELDLSADYTIIVSAMTWVSPANGNVDASQLAIAVDDETVYTTPDNLVTGYVEYVYKANAATNRSKVKFTITGKRGYINSIRIISGHDYTAAPAIVLNSVPDAFEASGDAGQIKYTIYNPVDGATVSASVPSNVDWITAIDCTTDGQIDFDVEANTGEEREAEMTISYGTVNKIVTIKQATGVTSGAPYTLSFPDDNSANNKKSGYSNEWTAKIGSRSWTITNFNNNSWAQNWTYIKCGHNKTAYVATITTDTVIPEAISTVTITVGAITTTAINSATLYVSTDSSFPTENRQAIPITLSKTDVVVTVPTPTENCYYKLEFDMAVSSKNGSLQINKVVYAE